MLWKIALLFYLLLLCFTPFCCRGERHRLRPNETTISTPKFVLERQISTTDFSVVKNGTKNVLGGSSVTLGEFPSFAVSDGLDICGATLIWNDVLVTSASCASLGAFASPGATVYIGGTQGDGSDAPERIGVRKVIPHPNFIDGSVRNDIMLVFLVSPSKANVTQFKNTDRSLPQDNETASVIGHGCLANMTRTRFLFKANVTILNFWTCAASFTTSFRMVVNESLCSSADEEAGPCQRGDIGGPMLSSTDGSILGIISVGSAGRRPIRPSIYTRISNYTSWIQRGICENSKVPPPLLDCPIIEPICSDCFPPPQDCTVWGLPGSLLRFKYRRFCSEICSPLPWTSIVLGWRCGRCTDEPCVL